MLVGKLVKNISRMLFCGVILASSVVTASDTLPGLIFEDGSLVSKATADQHYGSFISPTKKTSTEYEQELIDLATALKGDPALIFRHLVALYEVEPRFGLSKGAFGAYLEKSGTPFDLANLMVDLARISGNSAEYVYGSIKLNPNELGQWFGIYDSLNENTQTLALSTQLACEIIANGGIPASFFGVTGNDCDSFSSSFTEVELAHVWVRIEVDGVWQYFDPSYKVHTLYDGIDLRDSTGNDCVVNTSDAAAILDLSTGDSTSFNSATYYTEFVESTALYEELQSCAIALEEELLSTYNDKSLEETLGGKIVVLAEDLVDGDDSHMHSSGTETYWSGEIPDQLKTEIHVAVVDKASGNEVVALSKSLDGLYGRFLSVHQGARDNYIPDDEKWHIYLNGYLQNSSADVWSDGDSREDYKLKIAINHPYANEVDGSSDGSGSYMDRTVWKEFSARNPYYTVLLASGNNSANIMGQLKKFKPNLTVNSIGTVGYQIKESASQASAGYQFLYQATLTRKLLARIHGREINHHHTLGLVSFGPPVDSQVYDANFVARKFVDVDGNFSISSVQENEEFSSAMAYSSLLSGYESLLLSGAKTFNGTAAALKVSDFAEEKVYASSASNWSVVKPLLQTDLTDSPSLSFQESYINNGFQLYLPDRPGTVGDGPVDNLPGYVLLNKASDELRTSHSSLGINYSVVEGEEGDAAIQEEMAKELPYGFLAVAAGGKKIAFMKGERKGIVEGFEEPSTISNSILKQQKHDLTHNIRKAGTVNEADGTSSFSFTDLVVGAGKFPYSLPFTRTYVSNSGGMETSDFGGERCASTITGACVTSWTHNYYVQAEYVRDAKLALGGRRAVDAVDAIVAMYMMDDLLKDAAVDSRAEILTALHVCKWLIEDMVLNAVSITVGPQKILFSEPAAFPHQSGYDLNLMAPIFVEDGLFFHAPAANNARLYIEGAQALPILGRVYFDGILDMANGTVYSLPVLAGYAGGIYYSGGGSNWGTVTTPAATISYPKTTITTSAGMQVEIAVEDYWPEHEQMEAVGYRSYTVTNSLDQGLYIADGEVVALHDKNTPLVQFEFSDEANHPVDGSLYANLTSVTDAVSKKITYNYSGDGRQLLENISSDGDALLAFSYDDRNLVTGLTDQTDSTWQYFLSGSSSVVEDPLQNSKISLYDSKLQLVQVTNEAGQVTKYEYDLLGRKRHQLDPDLTEYQWNYDAFHNVILEEQKPFPGALETASLVSEATYQMRTYDNTYLDFTQNLNLLTQTKSPRGVIVNRDYTSNGLLSFVEYPAVSAGTPSVTFGYNDYGLVNSHTNPSGVVTSRSYDQYGYLRHEIVDDGSLSLKTVYQYDRMGNVCRTFGARAVVAAESIGEVLTGGYSSSCDGS